MFNKWKLVYELPDSRIADLHKQMQIATNGTFSDYGLSAYMKERETSARISLSKAYLVNLSTGEIKPIGK